MDDPVDLSGLTAWPGSELEPAIARVLDGVRALETPTLSRIMVRQGGVALLLAFATVLAAWLPAVMRDNRWNKMRAAELVSEWAASGSLPPDVDVTTIVGAFDAE